jgi:uncharacterized protein YchJ
MNNEKIDACEKNCMSFWKEHKDNSECMHCGRSRYMNVINEDGAYVTTKVCPLAVVTWLGESIGI